MTQIFHMNIRGAAVRRFVTLALLGATLAACSFAPLGQAEAPTSAAPTQGREAAPTNAPAAAGSATAEGAPAATQPPAAPTAALSAATPSGEQPVADAGLTEIAGTFTYSNDFVVKTYFVEHAAALLDMYGFVTRDQEWKMPVESQVLGFMEINLEDKRGEYRIQLPERPLAQYVDVDHDGSQDSGIQVFAAAYSPNLTGGPYSEGDDANYGWPSYLTSTVMDSSNNDEVTGGKLVIWAPDDQQQFPTEFGADGRLFTQDDPVGALPAGYSVIDLDQKPFAVSQDAKQDLKLYEPNDFAIKDFSNLSYSEAFTQMIDRLRKEYAFNGIAGKEPDWDAILRDFSPRVAEAERDRDADAFAAAIHDFTLQFRDGHVGGSIPNISQLFRQQAGGGYGFAGRELDDGRFIVTFVLENGPAAQAGMKVGAEVTAFGDKPIKQAIGEVKPFEGPFSTDFGLRTAQQQYLVRAPVDSQTSVTFANRGTSPVTAQLTAAPEVESYLAALPRTNNDPVTLPVEARTLESGIGYIKINSNYDDLGLIVRLFQRALATFEENQVASLIIDERHNPGGNPLGLAGFLTDQEIPLGQSEYYNDTTGRFEPDGPRDKVRPNQQQYRFENMAVLVDQTCTSACEIEVYAFSQVPGMIVVGQYPTGGVEADVARGKYELPEGISLQFSAGRLTLPDGSLFLEGTGVQPTVRVPIDERSVLPDEDVVLKAAEAELAK
jgi:C-terminal processing protease CtpA/Prc